MFIKGLFPSLSIALITTAFLASGSASSAVCQGSLTKMCSSISTGAEVAKCGRYYMYVKDSHSYRQCGAVMDRWGDYDCGTSTTCSLPEDMSKKE